MEETVIRMHAKRGWRIERRPTHNVKIILGIPFLPKFFHDDDIPSPMLSPRSRLITD
jgi:hypothetical protein